MPNKLRLIFSNSTIVAYKVTDLEGEHTLHWKIGESCSNDEYCTYIEHFPNKLVNKRASATISAGSISPLHH